MLNKRIVSELAVGVIIITAVVMGGIFFFQNEKDSASDFAKKNIVFQNNKITEKKSEDINNAGNQKQELLPSDSVDACTPHMYAGEASIKGSYVLSTIPGSTKKEWLFKIANEDLNKLPSKVMESGEFNGLLFIADVSPEVTEKLKKATEVKPGLITIKRFYLDCVGVPIASTESEGGSLLKYIKKG